MSIHTQNRQKTKFSQASFYFNSVGFEFLLGLGQFHFYDNHLILMLSKKNSQKTALSFTRHCVQLGPDQDKTMLFHVSLINVQKQICFQNRLKDCITQIIWLLKLMMLVRCEMTFDEPWLAYRDSGIILNCGYPVVALLKNTGLSKCGCEHWGLFRPVCLWNQRTGGVTGQ